ncbi:MAG: hypothetical protein E7231_14975 [Cellulosilyticum sp.]|nr:hypothetical protein [Cellulosilyticum sp.]
MGKIHVLYVQEKKIKNKKKIVTLGSMIDTMVPDTYEMDYTSIKEDIFDKIDQFQPKIVHIFQSNACDIVDLVTNIKQSHPEIIIFVSLSDAVSNPLEMMEELKAAGVYKSYGLTLIMETLIHDMFVALNME